MEGNPSTTPLDPASLYDLYAPAVYGHIYKSIPQVPIADKILEKVFLDAFQNRIALHNTLRSPLTTLLNHSREKTLATLEALHIFRECCAGTTVQRLR